MSSDNPPITVHTVTADLSDSELRVLAADAGCPSLSVPAIRELVALKRLSDSIHAHGVLTFAQSLQRASEQLGVARPR